MANPSAYGAGALTGPAGRGLGFSSNRRLSAARYKEFTLHTNFKQGYRNREDITILPPGIMVAGSQNVLTNVYERIANRQGYTLDGQADSTAVENQSPILSSFDWPTHIAAERHLRAGFLSSAGNDGKLQYRYVAAAGDRWESHTFTAGQVYWIDLMTALTSVSINFTDYWDTTEQKAFLKWVDGSSNIYEWTGGVTTLASATSDTITKNGVETFAEINFYNVIKTETATTIAFVAASRTITDSGSGFVTAGFTNGMHITVTGTANNNGTYTIATVAAGVITLIATDVLVDESAGSSFTLTETRQVTINGTTYNYTGGADTTTLTGVTPSPALEPINSVIQQTVVVTPSTAIIDLPSLNYSLITNFKQYLIVADLKNRTIYGSKLNNAYDFSSTSPTRLVGEGFDFTLDSFPTALITQDQDLYVSGGQDDWYLSQFTLSSDLLSESISFNRLKTTSKQAAQSQAWVTKIKNNIAYLSFEPIINSLGPVTNILNDPQTSDISYSIVNDINSYDSTDGSQLYHKMFLYVAFPKQGIVRIYNMTDQSTNAQFYWEAPQTIPASRFSVIDGSLYFHSYQLGETYKLFDGYNDNGHPIHAVATFSFNNNGIRTESKSFNEYYVEGYIKPNTTLTLGVQYDYLPNGSPTTKTIVGTDKRIVLIAGANNSLGKVSLGKNPIGSTSVVSNPNMPENKFRVIETFTRNPYYEEQTTFSSTGKDFQWEILAYGTNAAPTSEGNNSIKV